jgi:hypothetical protein
MNYSRCEGLPTLLTHLYTSPQQNKWITVDQIDFLPSTLSPTAATIVLDLYDIRNVRKSDFRMYGAQCENNDALTIKIR